MRKKWVKDRRDFLMDHREKLELQMIKYNIELDNSTTEERKGEEWFSYSISDLIYKFDKVT